MGGRSVTSGAMTAPDLQAAATVVDLAQQVVGKGVRHLSASGGPDAHQVLAYDLAHAAAASRRRARCSATARWATTRPA